MDFQNLGQSSVLVIWTSKMLSVLQTCHKPTEQTPSVQCKQAHLPYGSRAPSPQREGLRNKPVTVCNTLKRIVRLVVW